jgi:hypothetical protein
MQDWPLEASPAKKFLGEQWALKYELQIFLTSASPIFLGFKVSLHLRKKYRNLTQTSFQIWMRVTKKRPSRKQSTKGRALLTITDLNKLLFQHPLICNQVRLGVSYRVVWEYQHSQEWQANFLTLAKWPKSNRSIATTNQEWMKNWEPQLAL